MLYLPGMELGDRIRRARIAKGLSLDKLGHKIGRTRQAVWQWEHGETTPTTANIKNLCTILEVPRAYFDDDDPPPDPLAGKLRQLLPSERAIIEKLADAMLAQRLDAKKAM